MNAAPHHRLGSRFRQLDVLVLNLLAILSCISTAATGFAQDTPVALQRYEWSQPAMGVKFQFVIYAHDREVAARAREQVAERIEALEQIFSDYRDDSEINRLPRRFDEPQPIRVSRELWQLLSVSQHWSERSQGAFDVTVGPLSKLWRVARRTKTLPQPEQIDSARQAVGYRQLKLGESPLITLTTNHFQLDFGGIAKGFAADEAIAILQSLGIQAALVDASGDIATAGHPPNGQPWRITLPAQEDVPEMLLQFSGQAVATSGSLYQALEINGRRLSHLIDPRTGQAIEHSHRVTVIAPDATTADALASAFSVLQPEESLALAKELPGIEVLILARSTFIEPADRTDESSNSNKTNSHTPPTSNAQTLRQWSTPGFDGYRRKSD